MAKTEALKNVLRNSYWAHPECILVAMLSDNDVTVRNTGVNRILVIQGDLESDVKDADNFVGGDLKVDESEDSGDSSDEYKERD